MKQIFVILFVLMLAGCGYKPASHQAKENIGEHLYIDTVIDLKDPENMVLIQDALNKAVLTRFHSRIAKEEDASTSVKVSLQSIDFNALSYDSVGYVSIYRAKVRIDFEIYGANIKETYEGRGKYDFPIEANTVISDSRRFEAIQRASENAIDGFIAFISSRGL